MLGYFCRVTSIASFSNLNFVSFFVVQLAEGSSILLTFSSNQFIVSFIFSILYYSVFWLFPFYIIFFYLLALG